MFICASQKQNNMFGFGKSAQVGSGGKSTDQLLNPKTITVTIDGKEVVFETGILARSANAAVTARSGDTMVLATVVMGKKMRDNINYFPLLVDYEERLYAAGKIKGSRWVKREGRATDDAILKGRVIDRTLRPLFPDGMRSDVQVVATILSIDGDNEPDMLAVNASAMALAISDIPFDGPVAAVRIGKIEGKYVVNPNAEQRAKSVMDLIVSGSGQHIMMVEAGLQFVTEDEIVQGVKFAQKFLQEFSDAQVKWQKEIGKPKAEAQYYHPDARIMDAVKALLTPEKIEAAVYVASKAERDLHTLQLTTDVVTQVSEQFKALEGEGVKIALDAEFAVDYILKKYQQKQILENEKRVDGRKLDETRRIECKVGLLPRTHGSALFTRGDTQALTTVTLGTKGDEQLLDGVEDPEEGRAKRYMHHYNFPGYSVGEVQPLRGAGR
ncbi:MAG TPA: polyribonucleotide nucleotidyltransferase, partial [Patescibacteria group bacterium]|nr:polyribonucleotide nucleotidyltransferase [Patescibacteria group bacterium]